MQQDRPDVSARPLLEMRGVTKSFGSTHALSGVELEVRPGEVHALLGENGAGKSTLMKILSGVHAPDRGEILLDGEVYDPKHPAAARAAGIGMIYQELNLAPHLSVEANILLGVEASFLGFVETRQQRRRVRKALELLGHSSIHPKTPVGRLSIASRQIVEIARSLVLNARIIVLDEPTSSLTLEDTERLFDVVDRLRERGVSIIYISHFLDEVFRVADRYTVLRGGESVSSGSLEYVEADDLIRAMVGRSLEDLYPNVSHAPGEPLLELQALSGSKQPRDIDLALHSGEILGVAGLIGAGRTEMLRSIYGLDPVRSGRVIVAGVAGGYRSPSHRLNQGIGLLSEDRKDEGLAMERSVADNMTLSDMSSVANWGFLSPSRQRQRAREWIDRLSIHCAGPNVPVSWLSGGNQQKVALARLLHQEADVLLLDEPTRGIDVGSKAQIYRLMGELAARGKAVLFVSSYLPELLGVCDRIAVLSRGRMVAVKPTDYWNEHSLLTAATSGKVSA